MVNSAKPPLEGSEPFEINTLEQLESTSPKIINLPEILWRFFRLAAINILSNLMVPLSGLLSVAFLGHLTEIRHLTGVTLSTILFNYIYRTLGFLRMGTTGMTAQAVGRDDQETVILIGLRNGLLALGMGLIILLLQYPVEQLGFAILSGAKEVESSGIDYYENRIWAAPATLLNFVLIGCFLGREQSGKVLLMSIIGNGANVIFDYLFIVYLGWESAGAGMATAISQYLMLITGMILVATEIKWQEVQFLFGKILDTNAMKAAVTLNGNIFIRTFAFLSAFAIFTNLSAVFGTDTLAENALLLQVVTLAIYVIDGLAFATESLAGIFFGKKVYQQLIVLLKIACITSLSTGIPLALIFIIFPNVTFGLLTNHLEIIQLIHSYVWWLFPVLGLGSIAFILDGYFLGLTSGAILRNAALIATLVGFTPIALIAWHTQSNHLLWLALTSFMFVRVITLLSQVPKTFIKDEN
ncbi:guanitoxin biosynthesis MATE family efflux transporter GntT [Floridanema evergladense]|uniref:Guanitoxin biosynthesis MATE family efflux transporter GntT n=1 Tax=Floridaenema evergladense BLCC-F167 TaxID=3153639 RepID=A0ABV4WLA4_9CYAN